jgi:putative flippase GtrA
MNWAPQFVRFAMTGGLATLLHYAILIALVTWGRIDPVVASSIGFAVSTVLNYAVNARFTFRSERPHAQALPRFVAVALVGFGCNAVLLWVLHTIAGLPYLLAQVAATVGVLGWNFVMNRTWTFAQGLPPIRS